LIQVAVVGAGQAGLATSCELTKARIEHVVLERGESGRRGETAGTAFAL
jgi:cation diffusion facilitator CzcD-associated flavoprotein CzcO